MNIRLCKMTKALARQYFSHFEMDSMLFSDDRQFRPFLYSQEESDARVDRYEQLKRIYLAVMLDQEPIGELVLKNMDPKRNTAPWGSALYLIHIKTEATEQERRFWRWNTHSPSWEWKPCSRIPFIAT